ncbi:MAG: alpha/beta fold hydrolase [Myxococcales bacterium]|nr:alpha/beta fold hydrolase [Myxococcales bacterium]
MSRRKGVRHLFFDLVDETSRLVERSQDAVWKRSIGRFVPIPALKKPAWVLRDAASVQAAVVHGCIRAVNEGLRVSFDVLESERDRAEATASEIEVPGRGPAVAEAVLNAAWGSYLARRGNALDLGMTLRGADGRIVPLTVDALAAHLDAPTRRIALFVHGLGATERCWRFEALRHHGDPKVTFGTMLARDFGYTSLYVRYNSGRHLVENARALAELLEVLRSVYPGGLDEIIVVGHSMGGLVARGAAHVAEEERLGWSLLLRHVVTLGSPIAGAPLARSASNLVSAGSAVELEVLRILSSILESRSAGVQDLAEGLGPVPSHARTFFVAATVVPSALGSVSSWLGDLLVPVESASAGAGPRNDPSGFSFPGGVVLPGLHHLQLASIPGCMRCSQPTSLRGGPTTRLFRASRNYRTEARFLKIVDGVVSLLGCRPSRHQAGAPRSRRLSGLAGGHDFAGTKAILQR